MLIVASVVLLVIIACVDEFEWDDSDYFTNDRKKVLKNNGRIS